MGAKHPCLSTIHCLLTTIHVVTECGTIFCQIPYIFRYLNYMFSLPVVHLLSPTCFCRCKLLLVGIYFPGDHTSLTQHTLYSQGCGCGRRADGRARVVAAAGGVACVCFGRRGRQAIQRDDIRILKTGPAGINPISLRVRGMARRLPFSSLFSSVFFPSSH